MTEHLDLGEHVQPRATRIGLGGRPRTSSGAALLALLTAGLSLPLWWYRVNRRLGIRGVPAAALAATAMGLWVAGSLTWTTIAIAIATYGEGNAASSVLLLGALAGGLATAAVTWTVVNKLRGAEAAAGLPQMPRPPVVALMVLAIPWYLTWPVVVAALCISVQRRLDLVARTCRPPGSAADGMTLSYAAWSRWRGDRALMARIARACAFAAQGEASDECRIALSAFGDVERFGTSREFKEDATASALRRFRDIRMEACGDDVMVTVRFTRPRPAAELPFGSGVVVLETRPCGDGSVNTVSAARDMVAAALNRGRGRFSKPSTGDRSTAASAREVIDAACARAEERARVLSVVVFLVAALLGFGFIPLLAGTGTGVREYGTFEIAAVLGSAAAFAFFPALVQSVSIGETAARERARRVSAQGAAILASTLIGAGVRLLLGG